MIATAVVMDAAIAEVRLTSEGEGKVKGQLGETSRSRPPRTLSYPTNSQKAKPPKVVPHLIQLRTQAEPPISIER